jgi:proteasome lid subunit RPN8/RPN11
VSEAVCIYLTLAAQADLRTFPWSDEREFGGVLMGSATGGRVYVDRVLPNLRPQQPDSTTIDYDEYFDEQRYSTDGRDDFLITGDVHSHPVSGLVRASDADLDLLERHSRKLGVWASLIVAPTEKWVAGYPVADWNDDPLLGGWVGVRGEVNSALVLKEPQRFPVRCANERG